MQQLEIHTQVGIPYKRASRFRFLALLWPWVSQNQPNPAHSLAFTAVRSYRTLQNQQGLPIMSTELASMLNNPFSMRMIGFEGRRPKGAFTLGVKDSSIKSPNTKLVI